MHGVALYLFPQKPSEWGKYHSISHLKRMIEANRRFALKDLQTVKNAEIDAAFPSYGAPYTVLLHMNYLIELKGLARMPAPKKTPARTWNGFVSCELTAEDKASFKVWDVDFGDAFDLMMGRVTEGYRLSISFNKRNDSYIASLTGAEGVGANEGYTLSAFGKDVATAIRVLAYKDSFILEGVWENAKVQPKDDIG